MYAQLAGITAISLVLIKFVTARNWSRLLVLGVLWIVLVVILDIIIALLMVNLARISKPDENEDNPLEPR
ncbi:MAG TPA: hypothetical protein VFS90_04925 [Pyrinomonadaceae bacterium]|nr:hypothetical protein [Pyrinomonadaceae bacterium]